MNIAQMARAFPTGTPLQARSEDSALATNYLEHKKNFERVLEAMKGSGEGKTIGHVAKDLKFPGAFMDAWRAFWARTASPEPTNGTPRANRFMSV